MTITIDVSSLTIGFFIGYAVVATIFLIGSLNERWSVGFSEGFRAGLKTARHEVVDEVDK